MMKSKGYAKGGKKQGYNARLDESLGMRRGKESSKSQSMKSRRDESKGMEKAMGRKSLSVCRNDGYETWWFYENQRHETWWHHED